MLSGELFHIRFVKFASVYRLESVLVLGVVICVAVLEVLVIKPQP